VDASASGLALLGLRPADNPYDTRQSLPFRFRSARFAVVRELIDATLAAKGKARIIDIGGTEQYWKIAGDYLDNKPVEIHLVNLAKADVSGGPFVSHAGDATRLDAFDDMSFDIVHSNSVIEHVGSWANQRAMAANVRRLAPVYYLQTPNFWFPLEPHFRTIGWHWLPQQLRYRLLMQRSFGFRHKAATVEAAMESVEGCALLDRRQMQALFPDAEIRDERVMGIAKSLMAVRA
jgi:hypothetical protein